MPAIIESPARRESEIELALKQGSLLPSEQVEVAAGRLRHSLDSPARPRQDALYDPFSRAIPIVLNPRAAPKGVWFELASTAFPGSRSLTPAEAKAYRAFRRSKYRQP
jgi:hypothetical protein